MIILKNTNNKILRLLTMTADIQIISGNKATANNYFCDDPGHYLYQYNHC